MGRLRITAVLAQSGPVVGDNELQDVSLSVNSVH